MKTNSKMHRGPNILYIVDKSLTSIHDIPINVPSLPWHGFSWAIVFHFHFLSLRLMHGVGDSVRKWVTCSGSLLPLSSFTLRPDDKTGFGSTWCCQSLLPWSLANEEESPASLPWGFLYEMHLFCLLKTTFFHKPTRLTFQASASQLHVIFALLWKLLYATHCSKHKITDNSHSGLAM